MITTPAGDLAMLTRDVITNEVVVAVSKAVTGKKSTVTWKDVATLMSQVYETYFPPSSIRTSFKDVEKTAKKYRDNDKRKLYLEQIYKSPKVAGKRKMFSMSDVVEVTEPEPKRSRIEPFEQVAIDIATENAELQRTVERLNEDNQALNGEIERLSDEIERLKQGHTAETERLKQRLNVKNDILKQTNTHLSNSLKASKQRLAHLYETLGKVNKPKHVNQSIKRKNSCIQKWRSESRIWKQVAKKCRENIESKSVKLKSLQTTNSNRKCRSAKKKQNVKFVAKMDTNILKESLMQTVNIVQKQKQELHYVENKLSTTEEQLHEAQSNKVSTRDLENKGRIHPAVKETSMLLQGIGVAEHEVGPVIQTVITKLTAVTLDGKLPSKSSQQRISSEMNAVSKQHLREVLTDEKDLTLKYDGTTKNGRHIIEVELETKTDTFFVGGQETVGGKATDYVKCITSVINEVDSNMLEKVANTMTDKVITNAAVDRGLEEIKGGKINSFRCAMHPLDTIHKQCDKFVRAHELTLGLQKNGKFPYQKSGESITQATLRSIDKLFHDSGCGLPQDLPQFLRSKGITGGENRLYPRWVGNRFNIYFVNASLLYMYDVPIKEFQTKVIPPRNNLHHAVFNVMAEGKLQPILRALGIVNKFLTGPWMAWQGTRQGILETSAVFSRVLDILDGIEAASLVRGFDVTAFGSDTKKDAKYTVLTTSTPQDEETTQVLAGLLHEVTVVMRRQLADHLPGGKYHNPGEDLQKKAESCTSNNISGERVFAKVDSMISKARSASLQKCINKSKFTINKVPNYLASKSKEERALIIKQATTQAGKDRIKEKAWKEELNNARKQKLNDSRIEIEKKEQNGRAAKEKIISSILTHGLWKKETDVDNGVKLLKKTPAMAAFKEQIRFRLDILGCPHPEEKKIAFTKTSQEATEKYLKELLPVAVPEDKTEIVQTIQDPSIIVGYDFNQKWSNDGVDTMCRGSIIRLANPQQKQTAEYECIFDDDEEPCFQTISEIITDIAVGDMFLYMT